MSNAEVLVNAGRVITRPIFVTDKASPRDGTTPLRHQLGMAYLDCAAVKIVGNVVISRHLPKHFYYVRLVHSRSHAARVVGSLAIIRGRVHDLLAAGPIPQTRPQSR